MKINFGAKIYEYEAPVTVYDAAREAELIDRSIIAAKVNGEVVALTKLIENDANVELLSFAQEDGKHVFRHTASHILAQAVKRLYPETKLTIGPAIDNGFYYDFDSEDAFSPDILKKIEDEMKKIVKENHKIERFELPREQAIAYM
ncbi:MAG: threonine--tRNA ligase, partial [Clostridia bacterium]|nr:threonine--tRNA ligase [Clostridia bacterium]